MTKDGKIDEANARRVSGTIYIVLVDTDSESGTRLVATLLTTVMVSRCAMLEHFGIFLVLAADKSPLAYHIEALVPSSPRAASAPQTGRLKLNIRLGRGSVYGLNRLNGSTF
ncbi:hypothetical protein BDM02DRAFT_3130464, partial [Thelephora ganbajun]